MRFSCAVPARASSSRRRSSACAGTAPPGLPTRRSRRRSSSAPAATSVPLPATCAAGPIRARRSSPRKRSFGWTAVPPPATCRRSCTSAAISRGTGGASPRATTSTSASAAAIAATSTVMFAISSAGSSSEVPSNAGAPVAWRGHAYLASGAGSRPLVAPGAITIGDAAGLAYPESGEGIKPAIESGRLAASVLIEAGGRQSLDDLQPYAVELERLHPRPSATPAWLQSPTAVLGRVLLGSATFTRHVVLDRWFLRVSGVEARSLRHIPANDARHC